MSAKAENVNIIDLSNINKTDANQNPTDSAVNIDFDELLNSKKTPDEKPSFKKRLFAKIRQNAYVFPLLLSFGVPTMCFVTYYAAVSANHLEPIFPYLSDTGTLAPQAGFFSMMMDLGALMFLFTGYYRYKMIQFYNKQKIAVREGLHTIIHYDNMNFLSAISMGIVSIGSVCVGNLRVSELLDLHILGAVLCFISTPLYICYQTYIAFWLAENKLESKPISMFIVAVVSAVSAIGVIVFTFLSLFEAGFENIRNADWRLNWTMDKPGYILHCIGTLFEWILILTYTPMSLCMFNRMRKFKHFDKI